MIYFERRALFIHIPRTSGMSISKAVLDSNHPDLNVVLGDNFGPFGRHAQAHLLKDSIQNFDQIQKICVIRNPWRIVESTYRLSIKIALEIKQGEHEWMRTKEKQIWLKSLKQTFEEFVFEYFKYLRKGFYAHWCLEWGTFHDLGVKAFAFESIQEHWPHICEILQLPTETILPHENSAAIKIINEDINWTQDAIEFIKSHCELDFQLFNYPRQP